MNYISTVVNSSKPNPTNSNSVHRSGFRWSFNPYYKTRRVAKTLEIWNPAFTLWILIKNCLLDFDQHIDMHVYAYVPSKQIWLKWCEGISLMTRDVITPLLEPTPGQCTWKNTFMNNISHYISLHLTLLGTSPYWFSGFPVRWDMWLFPSWRIIPVRK